jgi:hypothetical protein
MVAGSTWRRRIAPALLFAGVAACLVIASRSRPTDTEVTVRFEGDRADVRSVEYAFVRRGEAEAIAGATLPVRPPVPPHVRTTAHLAAGSYDVTISIERVDGRRSTSVHRVELQGSPVVLPVSLESP